MRILEQLKMEDGWNTRIFALMSCARYLGIQESNAWMFGATGYAFAMHIDKKCTGFGPQLWNAEGVYNVGHNLGFAVHGESAMKHDGDFAFKQRRAFENAKRAIDQDYPCFGYNLSVPEYYVINGYDEEGYYYSGFGTDANEVVGEASDPEVNDILNRIQGVVEDESEAEKLRSFARTHGRELIGQLRIHGTPGYVREIIGENTLFVVRGKGFTPWQHLGTGSIGLLELFWLEPCERSGDRDTVREALSFAMRFAESPSRWVYEGYKAGIAAYDHWIHALKKDRPSGFDLSYNGECWSECRKYAPMFLREAAERIGGRTAGLLGHAAEIYDEVYASVRAAAELLPFDSWKPHHVQEKERIDRMIGHIEEAKVPSCRVIRC